MADDARQPMPDLTPPPEAMPETMPETMDIFELLRLLETGGRVFGHAGRPDREPARLGQQVRLAFAVQDVAGYRPAAGAQPARVTQAAIGLLGPEGPMPIHLTRWVLDRLSQRWFAAGRTAGMDATSDTTFVDFANILQHRMIALYYRAWADARPEVQIARAGGGRVQAMRAALAGFGLPGAAETAEIDAARLRQAPALGHQVTGPERLTRLLADVLGVPVALREYVGGWMAIPAALQTRLGGAHAGLGRSAAVGPRSFQRQTRIELRLGPLSLPEFESLLPGGARVEPCRRAILHAIGLGLDVDLRPVLARDQIPAARLGAARLGRTAWLCPRRERDALDLRLAAFVGQRPEAMAA